MKLLWNLKIHFTAKKGSHKLCGLSKFFPLRNCVFFFLSSVLQLFKIVQYVSFSYLSKGLKHFILVCFYMLLSTCQCQPSSHVKLTEMRRIGLPSKTKSSNFSPASFYYDISFSIVSFWKINWSIEYTNLFLLCFNCNMPRNSQIKELIYTDFTYTLFFCSYFRFWLCKYIYLFILDIV